MSTLETIDREITGLFKDAAQVMWKRLTPILGIVTNQHLFRQAVSKNLGSFAWLNVVEFIEEGPELGEPNGPARPTDQVEIRRGLATVVKPVLDILTVLTGDILTSDLQPAAEEFVKRASIEGA